MLLSCRYITQKQRAFTKKGEYWTKNTIFWPMWSRLFFITSNLTLGSDDPIIFKCFRVIFSLKKKTFQFPLSFNLYFQQTRVPKFSICHLLMKRSVWIFDVTNRRNDFSNFQSYLQVVMYLFNSLAKSCTLFCILKILLNH